ncbi:MAG: rhodanese-like domain-containing protein [Clostridiales bacterium]|nr:rhodanese-like domain-containing protein [Clostridiales bacterium]
MKKNKILILLFAIVMLFSVTACGNKSETEDGYNKITSEEAKAIIDSEEDVIILDVRTKEEFDGGHIENAVLLPNTEIKDKVEELIPDKDAKILVYCRSGNRSASATKDMLEIGYTNVYDFGGIVDWEYETVT